MEEHDPPPPSPPRLVAKPENPNGSLGKGFGIGCAVLVGGGVLAGSMVATLSQALYRAGQQAAQPVLVTVAVLLPIGALVGFAVHFIRQGQRRTAGGILAAFLAMLAIGLLLVAACAALLSGI